jgi:hypothetical protein
MRQLTLFLLFTLAATFALLCAGTVCSSAANQKTKGDWTPPNPEAPLATLDPSVACPITDLLAQAGQRATEMVENLQSFTARETVNYEQLNDLGVPTMGERVLFEYAVGFEERTGALKVTEARSAAPGSGSLSAGFQDSGLVAIALIFPPYYQGDYEMRCEGLTEDHGGKAWVIHFEQRKDKRSRVRSFRTDQGSYPAKLKGRAWISAESHQVVHIETSLIAGIPMIHLKSDGVKVEYAPVPFASRNLTLWLPRASESYSDFETYKLVVKHSFSDYLISSVETQQVIGAPSTEAPKN